MGVIQTRPDNLYSQSAGVTVIGGGSLSDNSDSTYRIIAPPGHTEWYMGDISGIDGVTYRILQVRPIVRMDRYNGAFTIDSHLYLTDGGGNYRDCAYIGGAGGGVFTIWGSWQANNDGGGEWTQAQVNNSRVKFVDYGGGSTGPEVMELYMEAEYRTRPNVSNVGPSGANPGATRRPNFTWTYSDPDGVDAQSGYRVKIFTSAQGNPDAGGAVYDSGDVSGNAGNLTIGADLNDGSYYAYVKVAKTFRGAYWWSGWGGTTFSLSFPPGSPSGLQRTGVLSDTTPNFSAFVTEPGGQQVKGRFQLYQNDGVTLIATLDSGYVTGSGTVSVEYGTPLAVGTYKVRAQSIDIDNLSSGWTSLISFDVAQTATKDLTALWNIKTTSLKDLLALWNVNANNTKDFTLKWDTLRTSTDDATFLWNIRTPWSKVTENADVWSKVGEL